MTRSLRNLAAFVLTVVILLLTFSEPVSATDCSPIQGCDTIC